MSSPSADTAARPDGPNASPNVGAAVTFATTEHFNLQTARAATVSEANGRATIYLAALSSGLIALAFIGQMSRLGPAFDAFALIVLPVLAFIGVVTAVRARRPWHGGPGVDGRSGAESSDGLAADA